MCFFRYDEFAACGHRVIDATEYCEKARWRAGMSGKLVPCPEVAFKLLLTRASGVPVALPNAFTEQLASSYAWMGSDGICKSCSQQQKVYPAPSRLSLYVACILLFS